MTSAVRDASNGGEFATAVRERYGLEARTLSGDEEARLTFLGATAARTPAPGERLLVIDIGGGSTELVIGERGDVAFHVSTQVGVVRHSERHLHSDPPTPEELDALSADAGPALAAAVPRARARAGHGGGRGGGHGDPVRGHRPRLRARRRRGPPALAPGARGDARAARRAPARRAPRGPRARPRPGADDRRRRGRPDPRRWPRSASTRSRCPTATSSGAQRSSWHPPARPTPYPPYGGFLDVCSIVSSETNPQRIGESAWAVVPPAVVR